MAITPLWAVGSALWPVWAGAAAAGAGVGTLRYSWGQAGRRAPLNRAGWAALALGVALGIAGAGAWGTAMVALAAMATAALILAQAAWAAPAGKAPRRTGRAGRQATRPGGGAGAKAEAGAAPPLRLGGRLRTFLLGGPLALAASLLAALGLRAAVVALGGGEADATMLAFLGVPLIWAGLVGGVLMVEGAARRLRLVLAPALGGGALLALATVLARLPSGGLST